MKPHFTCPLAKNYKNSLRHWLTIFLIGFVGCAAAQTATIIGTVSDAASKEAVDFATVYVKGTNNAAETNLKGQYRIEVETAKRLTLVFSRTGYEQKSILLKDLKASETRTINVSLKEVVSDMDITVTEKKLETTGMVTEEVEALKLLPSTTGNLESVLPHIALGVSSGTGGELSSQYNVRGGNYDENLVYVNDFEVYRPQLIRAGQQEGLTFANIDLMQSLSFSSGGFEAKYGDKLSSVLDIKYKLPTEFKASVSGSFLGGTAHIEGSTEIGKNLNKLRYLVGARYKTTRYLLGTLDITGEYTPDFTDVQAYVTYDLNPYWQLGILGNYNRSVYRFIPQERNSGFGLFDFALNLFAVFDGQEIDDFTTQMTGVSMTYLPERDRNPLFVKFMASTYQSVENERFDIIGRYSLQQIENNLGSDNFGEVVGELGNGTQQQFVRNSLNANVSNLEVRGGIELQADPVDDAIEKSHFLQWSAKYQYEFIDDRLNEWERLDSAGYSLRYDTNAVLLNSVLKTRNNLESNRLSAFLQDTYTFRKDSAYELRISAGVRATYWDLNQELLVSPRAQLLYKPLDGKRDISLRLAGGLYAQPPFYRELRRLDGVVNTNLLAQKSAHVVGGLTWDFGRRKTKYRFIGEVYYKRLWDLVSYDIENVRIRYSGENDATGYVAGIDLRLNGEFVPGAESWFNLSFLRAREALNGVQHQIREIGDTEGQDVSDVPRPTDQAMTLSVFFQDYLPKNENFKMHLNFTVGTGLAYGLLGNNRTFRNTYRFPAYHRVDIGFSYALWDATRRASSPKHFLRFSESAWLSLEIFNLMQVQNVASNTWIKTVFNQQYAIPNYLTSRRINLRMRFEF
ncbi:MAG: TonB-dependent receptor [Bacteroidota bacterium]